MGKSAPSSQSLNQVSSGSIRLPACFLSSEKMDWSFRCSTNDSSLGATDGRVVEQGILLVGDQLVDPRDQVHGSLAFLDEENAADELATVVDRRAKLLEAVPLRPVAFLVDKLERQGRMFRGGQHVEVFLQPLQRPLVDIELAAAVAVEQDVAVLHGLECLAYEVGLPDPEAESCLVLREELLVEGDEFGDLRFVGYRAAVEEIHRGDFSFDPDQRLAVVPGIAEGQEMFFHGLAAGWEVSADPGSVRPLDDTPGESPAAPVRFGASRIMASPTARSDACKSPFMAQPAQPPSAQ